MFQKFFSKVFLKKNFPTNLGENLKKIWGKITKKFENKFFVNKVFGKKNLGKKNFGQKYFWNNLFGKKKFLGETFLEKKI